MTVNPDAGYLFYSTGGPYVAFLQVGEVWVRVDMIEAVGGLDYCDGSHVRTVSGREYVDQAEPPEDLLARLVRAVHRTRRAADSSVRP